MHVVFIRDIVGVCQSHSWLRFVFNWHCSYLCLDAVKVCFCFNFNLILISAAGRHQYTARVTSECNFYFGDLISAAFFRRANLCFVISFWWLWTSVLWSFWWSLGHLSHLGDVWCLTCLFYILREVTTCRLMHIFIYIYILIYRSLDRLFLIVWSIV